MTLAYSIYHEKNKKTRGYLKNLSSNPGSRFSIHRFVDFVHYIAIAPDLYVCFHGSANLILLIELGSGIRYNNEMEHSFLF